MAGNPIRLKEWLLKGVVITIPLVVTVIILLVVLDFILGVLSPVVIALAYFWPNEPPTILIEIATLISLVGLIILVGLVSEQTPGAHIMQKVDEIVTTAPGVGTVYTSIRQVSELLSDDGEDQFQEVKLIEFPHQDAYVLGFLTGDTPETIEDCAGYEEMVTVMVPLGPNPTSNGFIMHMPVENVYDIDFTVEEAIQSIATLGVATEPE